MYVHTVPALYSVERFRERRARGRTRADARFAKPFYRIYDGNGTSPFVPTQSSSVNCATHAHSLNGIHKPSREVTYLLTRFQTIFHRNHRREATGRFCTPIARSLKSIINLKSFPLEDETALTSSLRFLKGLKTLVTLLRQHETEMAITKFAIRCMRGTCVQAAGSG